MSLLGKIFGAGKSPLDSVADVVDRFVDTKADKYERFKEIYQMQAEERANARQLYGTDSLVQKIYALTFLGGYLLLTGWLLYAIIQGSIQDVNQFETGMIGTIWGAMSAKVNTVVDFFFGSSDKANK